MDAPASLTFSHGVVFVLTCTVVSVQYDCCFSKIAIDIVKHADNCICTLADIGDLVDAKIDLSWDSFGTNPEESRFPRSEKVNGAGLCGIARVVLLLSKVE